MTKDEILNILLTAQTPVSGEEMSRALGVSRAAVWTSFIVGVGLTVSNMFLKFIASPINAGAIAMVLGLILVPIVSLFTPKPKIDVDGIFDCYEQPVTVSAKTSIEDED